MDEPKPLHIEVDDRECWGPMIRLLQQSPEFRVTVTRLRLGDYLLDNHLLFERKTLADLVRAVVSGRLFSQALRPAAAPLRSAMILEGTSATLAESGMSWDAIQGALITVNLFCGLPLLRTRTPEETVRTMCYAARQGRSFATGALPRPGYRPRGKQARQLFILQGLPGIGPERARRLLARFGSAEGVVRAHAEELRSVRGIGKEVAEKIRWSLEEPSARYS